MVSIGGDRATNEDYRRANREAVLRSQRRPKSEPKRQRSEPKTPKVLGRPQRQLTNRPLYRTENQQQARPSTSPNQPKYKKPFELGLQGYHWTPPSGATQPFGFSKDNQEPRDINKPGAGIYTPGPDKDKPAKQANVRTKLGQEGATSDLSGATRQGLLAHQDTLNAAKAQGVDPATLFAEATGGPARQPGFAPGVPSPIEASLPLPELSDGVRELLNSQNWKTPKKGKAVRLPKSSYEKGSLTQLEEHDYTLTDEQWNLIKKTYSSDQARALGYQPPATASKAKPLMHTQDDESMALNWEDYEKMSTEQKAAVDYNTVLLDRTQEDLEERVKLKGAKLQKYTSRVDKLFGKGGGSDVVALNTVDLLEELDMDLVGQDIDEYLSGERAIDDEEIMDFKFSSADAETLNTLANATEPVTGEAAYERVRSQPNMEAVDTSTIQKTQQMIKTALKDGGVTYDFATMMAGDELKGQPPMGFGDETTKWSTKNDKFLNDWFQESMFVLSSPDPRAAGLSLGYPADQDPMSFQLEELDLMTQGDKKVKQQFLDYIANTNSLVGQYGGEEGAAAAKRTNTAAGMKG